MRFLAPLIVTLALACTEAPAETPLATATRAADWQLANMPPPGVDGPGRTEDPRSWVQGTFFVGLTALADATSEPRFSEAVFRHGVAQRWRPGGRRYSADDQLIGYAWLWANERDATRASRAPIQERLDAVLEEPPNVSLTFTNPSEGGGDPCQRRWCWADALFMAPPTWARLSRVTGDPRYLQHADSEWRAAHALLFSDGLYYRDSRAIGTDVLWSRGNGWAFAGMARFLGEMPADYPGRSDYETWFRALASRLITLQRTDGLWSASLLERDDGDKETSGTALIVYALARGVNDGLLDRTAYAPAIERGWSALADAVDDNGRLGWVQPVGGSPAPAAQSDMALYGVGALLLAAVEVERLGLPEGDS